LELFMPIRFDADYQMTIDGAGVTATETIDVVNPATEEVIARVPNCEKSQLDAAVDAATKAFRGWKARPVADRKAVLEAIAQEIEANVLPLGRLMTQEQGKPLADAKGEIQRSAMWFRETAKKELPITTHVDDAGRKFESRHVPLGVVGAITPWNFPVALGVWKIAPALLSGNTVVWKPSPFTPLCALKIGELLRQIVPPGVLNVISGGDRLGPWVTEHPRIQKVGFTGSTATGKRVMQSAAGNLKRLTLELGGNDAAIVLPDVEVKATAEKIFWGAFRNSAQVCIAAKRVYVHERIYDEFSRALVEFTKTVKLGNGLEEGTKLGPIQNKPQFQRVKSLIEESKANGLRLLTGSDAPPAKGYFVPVTIVDNPPEDSRVVKEEAFGPVLPLLKFRDTSEVVRRANDSDFGLGASVWSSNIEEAKKVAEQLECGTVWINCIQLLSPHVAFGGHKQSGIGVEHSTDGLLEYTNIQTIVV
jgi:acyl-CoA reductase-like NAD-dependent aldehyde dehydrogenase